MLICRTVYKMFAVKEWRDLKTGCNSCSKSLKMAPFHNNNNNNKCDEFQLYSSINVGDMEEAK